MTIGEALTPTTQRAAKPARIGQRVGWRIYMLRLAVLAIILLAWWLVTFTGFVSPILLPGPWDVVVSIGKMAADGSLWFNVGVTLEAAAIGFVIGLAAGVIVGFLLGLSTGAAKVAAPFITSLNSMPRIALAPMFVIWFGIGLGSGVALVISLVFFIALTNTLSGAQSVDRGHLVLARLYGAGRFETIGKVVLPATVPWILAAGRLSLANALSGAIVAEMFLGQSGLGFLIVTSSGLFDMGRVFAAVIVALIIAALLDWLGTILENYLLRWRPVQS